LRKSIEFPPDIYETFTMSLSLQILNGHRYGETLIFDNSTSIGRHADISFDDLKMSKIHALFEMDPYLGWFIKDQESKNGIIVNGERRESHLLVEGDLLEVGGTQLRVASVSAFWKPVLNQILIETLDTAKDGPLETYPFRQIPTLNFIQGLQAGTTHVLEYGPRQAGGESDDIQIFEPQCPDFAFELISNKQGVVFKTNYPSIVRINNKELAKKVLKKGDQIHIHNTVIEIDFLNL
jgi:hypothetical protein